MHFVLRPIDATPDEEVARLLTHGASLQEDVRGTYGPGTGWSRSPTRRATCCACCALTAN